MGLFNKAESLVIKIFNCFWEFFSTIGLVLLICIGLFEEKYPRLFRSMVILWFIIAIIVSTDKKCNC